MVATELGQLILEIVLKNLPLALFIFSIILSGNLVRIILLSLDFKNHTTWSFKIDAISVTSGLVINFISLASMKIFSIVDFSPYILLSTWLRVGIITGIFMLGAWKYKTLGEKWIKDIMLKIFALILGILFIVGGFNSLKDLFEIRSFLICQNIFCKIGVILQKTLFLLFVAFLFYAGFKLVKEASKTRRYKKG